MCRSLKLLSIGTLAVLVAFSSCRKDPNNPVTTDINQLKVDPNFNWATTQTKAITISAKDNLDDPIEGVRFTLYTADPDSGGIYLVSGVTGNDGIWNSSASLPSSTDTVTVFNNFLGLIRQMKLPVTGNGITGSFGGKPVVSPSLKSSESASTGIKSTNAIKWVYMSTYSTIGVPNNLLATNDPVSQTLLKDLNAALPEYRNEVTAHPEYFTANVLNTIDLVTPGDVYITYIAEGAGWTNSVGYFVFNTNQPPTLSSQIDTVHVIFPNMSNTGSGGGLNPGNKVYLGRFPAGKSIGFVVVPHGWNGKGTYVGPTSDVWYSIPSFNTSDPLMPKHLLLFNDTSRQQILFTFEDQGKYQGSDQDCNDGICYLTINPIQSVNAKNVPVLATTMVDQDHDGIPDYSDDYPTDPTKAFNNYTPSKTGLGTLAFEDLWPSRGDYDFNDLVLSYRFNQITNAQNKVMEIDATIIPEAIGASYHSGFGFQLPYPPDKILFVTGASLKKGYVTLSANKTESGQTKAVIVAFDDAFDVLHATGSGFSGSNTTPGNPYVKPDTLRLVITFSAPLLLSQAGTPPYNSFLIVDGNRNREIHLPDQPPTDLVDGHNFGTFNDNSNASLGRYYKTVNNLPWALNISEKFNYPIEKSAINTGFLKFNSWAQSSGLQFVDWYKNLTGYRVAAKIYSH